MSASKPNTPKAPKQRLPVSALSRFRHIHNRSQSVSHDHPHSPAASPAPSGRSPKIDINSFVHVVNNYWYENSGHCFEGEGGYALVEGNTFEAVNAMESDWAGAMLASASDNSACASALGREVEVVDTHDDWAAGPGADLDRHARERLQAMFDHYDRAGFCGGSAVLTQLLGRTPTTWAEWVRRHWA